MIILKNCCNGKCTQPLICKTDNVYLTELPAFVLSRTAKQTPPCQLTGDELQKCVRLFRYSYWLLRKSILNLANRIFADLRHVRNLRYRKSLTRFVNPSSPDLKCSVSLDVRGNTKAGYSI